ncbi:MAG TPA: hypothetical protein VFI13_02405 [Gemmatimonadales bacterium]|nr:hypothetical protein [Gemmatimonadales bacterium]
MTLLDLVAGLLAARIDFIIVGGVAGVAHGSRRVTDDLDILYDTAPGNLERLGALLTRWHAYPREIEPGLPFLPDARTLRNTAILTLLTDAGLLDLLHEVAGVGDFHTAAPEAVTIDLPAGAVRVLSLDQLIRAKRATGRPKDGEHLIELEALRELTRE